MGRTKADKSYISLGVSVKWDEAINGENVCMSVRGRNTTSYYCRYAEEKRDRDKRKRGREVWA